MTGHLSKSRRCHGHRRTHPFDPERAVAKGAYPAGQNVVTCFPASVRQLGILSHMMSPVFGHRRAKFVVALLLLMFGGGAMYAAWPGHTVFWLPEGIIASYLKRQTPFGTSRPSVIGWLKTHVAGVKPFVAAVPVPANSAYPPSRVGGASFVTAEIASYRFPFATSVEAFYIFDDRGNLTDISVRRTIVAP